MINYCQNVRKDCMAILDAPRQLVLSGAQKKIRKTAPENTFSNQIAPSLKYITGLNTSYAAMYVSWMGLFDSFSAKNFWVPQSVKMGGIYVRNDIVGNFWDAPFGLNRGIISEVNDVAFNPKPKEEDQLYIRSLNYVRVFPLDGFVAWGQKTTQVRPSAFDRVNVRRLFLRLERFSRAVLIRFIAEPNNFNTRRRVVDNLAPTFRDVLARGGLEDFQIISNETNNPPEVRDRNELRVAVFMKPTRTAEFILADFVALRSDATISFDELI